VPQAIHTGGTGAGHEQAAVGHNRERPHPGCHSAAGQTTQRDGTEGTAWFEYQPLRAIRDMQC
jgi:hypothetical protein